MALADGTYQLGPDTGRVLVKTGRQGLGARAGHDLTIEVTRWAGSMTVQSTEPAGSSVMVTVDVDSLEVREGAGGVKPLTDADRADIKKTIREKILHTAQHPEITFRSTRVTGTADSFAVEGDLRIKGVTRPVTVRGRLVDDRVRGTAAVVQSQWGIKPFSALLGALKLKDEVEIEFDLAPVPAG